MLDILSNLKSRPHLRQGKHLIYSGAHSIPAKSSIISENNSEDLHLLKKVDPETLLHIQLEKKKQLLENFSRNSK
jgi:hypothetical protein